MIPRMIPRMPKINGNFGAPMRSPPWVVSRGGGVALDILTCMEFRNSPILKEQDNESNKPIMNGPYSI